MRIAALVKQIPAFEEMELGRRRAAPPRGPRPRDEPVLPPRRSRRRSSSPRRSPATTRWSSSPSARRRPTTRCARRSRGPPTGASRRPGCSSATPRSPAPTPSRPRGRSRLRSCRSVRSTSSSPAATRSTPTPARWVRSSRRCSGCPFLTGVKELTVDGDLVHARCEHDDALRDRRGAVPDGPVGGRAADRPLQGRPRGPRRRCPPTASAPCRPPSSVPVPGVRRARRRGSVTSGSSPETATRSCSTVTSVEQARRAVELLVARGAFRESAATAFARVAPPWGTEGAPVAVLAEPDRAHETRELLGAAAGLAAAIGGHAVALDGRRRAMPGCSPAGGPTSSSRSRACRSRRTSPRGWPSGPRVRAPWAIVAPSTAWGREVAGRVAAALGAGLTGDAVDLEVGDGRLLAWKPAFGGQLVAAIHVRSPIADGDGAGGCARPARAARRGRAGPRDLPGHAASRVCVLGRERDDDLDVLAEADAVVGVGRGVDPDRLPGPRTAAPGARRRAGCHPQGDRQRVAAPRPADRHHRPGHRPAPVRVDRRERQVQPHGRGARGRDASSRSTPTRRRRCSGSPTSGSSPTGRRRFPH